MEEMEINHGNTLSTSLYLANIPAKYLKECNANACEWDSNEMVCRYKVSDSRRYKHNCQIMRHTVLLICLTIPMLVGKLFK